MYRYRCGTCGTTSLPVRTRVELHADRDRHRRQFHGGHVPDGEQLQRYRHPHRPADTSPIAWTLAALIVLFLIWLAHH